MRKFVIEFPEYNISAVGTVLEDEPQNADSFWDWMAKPQKCFTHPTISTGEHFSCWPRPPYDPPAATGDQTTHLSNNSPILCTGDKPTESHDGEILWSGWNPAVTWGYITEPLISGDAVVGQIDPEYIDALQKGGKQIWYQTVFHHTLGIVIFHRKED